MGSLRASHSSGQHFRRFRFYVTAKRDLNFHKSLALHICTRRRRRRCLSRPTRIGGAAVWLNVSLLDPRSARRPLKIEVASQRRRRRRRQAKWKRKINHKAGKGRASAGPSLAAPETWKLRFVPELNSRSLSSVAFLSLYCHPIYSARPLGGARELKQRRELIFLFVRAAFFSSCRRRRRRSRRQVNVARGIRSAPQEVASGVRPHLQHSTGRRRGPATTT